MKAGIVLNPHACGGRAGRRWPEAARALETRLGPLIVRATTRGGEASPLARELCLAGCDVVFAAGGDGTLNEVINGVLGAPREPAVGFVPLGSGNDFLRTLGRPAHETLLDVVRLRCHAAVDRYYINVASVGLGAETARIGGRLPKVLPARLRYLASTLPSLARGGVVRIRISLDGGAAREFGLTTLALANGRYQGGGIFIAPDAQLDDGLLDVTLVESVGLVDLALNLPILYNGAIYAHPKVRHWRAKRVSLEADPAVAVEMDGEVVGSTPLDAEVLPSRLRLAAF